MYRWSFYRSLHSFGAMCALLLFAALSAQAQNDDLSHLVPLSQASLAQPQESILGKARVWVFLSSKCPCSNSHIEKLKKAYEEFSSKGIEFIGVHSNQDEPEDASKTYFQAAHLGFPVFGDPGAKIADHFGALKTPHVFIEAPDHQILYEGGIDSSKNADSTQSNYLRDALLEIQAGQKVSRTRTRSLGCVISRKAKS